ncbi:hypothetical protein ALC56_09557 [Trachymyrmex septentrionalis]|uniref:Gustatory receptor n=1 Tax=Trachymyrmex septentrionalis TaxID=34720 RepID=A0A151JUZ1_9HYME|nr:hypothetical protein ALC56_09557 [Trachymyrmex septentrionalis]
MCLHELSVIDDTLEALDVPKEYQRLRNFIIRIIITWIVCIFYYEASYLFMISYIQVFDRLDFIFIFDVLSYIFLIQYPTYINILSTLIWGTILRYTSSRFHQINNRLQIFCSDLFENNADRRQNRCILVRQQITAVKGSKQYIWIIM